ncbi:SPFH domain-containing protein [Desulfobacula toluolica]|uniref:SPFH domain / band 7 family membrane protein n=1 Tax=Desulfobacula toluolica (strain DSM 7467 / Tol2) TaxID=651182 RepID=K0NSC5_DESTT|nr:SPFH domain-containing protein [Desulfobacula toluolica]CCK81882.1 SPFH domain / band 7 family membrane protein [Desulfobacula toluolica Tol2]
MKKLIFIIFSLTCLITFSGCIPHSTDSTEVGIRTKKFSFFGKKGVEEKYYAPGSTYFFLPFINDWHTFDTKLQNLEMTFNTKSGDRKSRDDLLFKTIDGNDISLDVIIAYKIDPSKAPYILQNVAVDDASLRNKIVRTIARSKPRDIFGELTTEEFYVASKRDSQAHKAKEVLKEMLNPLGITVERVLTKDYRFNSKYQQAIEDKKVADQLVEKNKSAQHASLEEYKRKLEEAKGEVNGMIADVDGVYQKAKIEADVYYERQKLLAEAIMAEGIAEAKGIMEMNKAMESTGGEALVKLAIAEALQGKKIVLLPVSEGGMNLKTTNINQLIDTMGIKKLSER